MIKRLYVTFVTLCLLCLDGMMAQSVTSFSYADHSADAWGTGKKTEHYDVAIKIDNAFFAGGRITSVSVPVLTDPDITGYRIWLSKELTLASSGGVKQCPGDISFDNLTPHDGQISIVLPQAWTIGDEGVYIGYSFDVSGSSEAARKPVLGAGGYKDDNALYIHTTRTYLSWKAYAKDLGFSSAISATIETDIAANSASLIHVDDAYAAANDGDGEGLVRAVISNTGSNDIGSIDIRCTADGAERVSHISFSPAIAANYTDEREVMIPLPQMADKGRYTLHTSIEKVNGAANTALANAQATELTVLTFVPRHRAVLEEYTGLWCGYCPRGFAAIEHMNAAFPDDFIALSYHDNDAMQVLDPKSEWPSAVNGLPSALIDRRTTVNAYSGYERDGIFGIDKAWAEHCRRLAPASIEACAAWTSAAKEDIEVTVSVRLAQKEAGRRFRPAFALTADGLHNAYWLQTNYYSGTSTQFYWQIPEMQKFTEGAEYVQGLTFDDVVVLAPHITGCDTTLPELDEDESTTFTYTFRTSEATNADGNNVIQDKSRLHVVAMLLDDATGEIVNACKTGISDTPNGIYMPAADSCSTATAETTYYTTAGLQTSTPGKGLYVVRRTAPDGRTTTVKTIMR